VGPARERPNAWARLRLGVWEQASVWVLFPVRPGQMHPLDVRELGASLEQIGRDIRAGRLNDSTSIAVPCARRNHMKVELVIEGTNAEADDFYWDFTMNYGKPDGSKKLKPAHAVEIGTVAESYAALISKQAGGAAAGDPAYKVSFKVSGPDVATPKSGGKAEITGQTSDLLYSEMVKLQDAGLGLLGQLNVPAHNEIASGQRK
jgi:hypothetical protein